MSDPMTPEVRHWMKRTDVEPPDAQQSARQVMARLPEVRQRRRWWPFPVLYRKPGTPTDQDASERGTIPIPATSGHTPTVIGRTQSMLSPAKSIIAGALVFALGGAFLVAQPFGQQGNVPAAETEVAAPTWITGNVQYAPSCSGPDVEIDGDVRHDWNYECAPQTWTASDPRLTGDVSYRWNEDVYRTDEGYIAVNTAAAYLQNDDGGWACSSANLYKGFGLFPESVTGETMTCVGEGGYEGLSALLVIDVDPSHPFVGLIFSGGFPPLPEPPADE